jgi:DNA polymerase-3 subunit delta
MSELSYNRIPSGSFPGELSKVYLILGDDDALKREAIAKILDSALDPSFADFDKETLDFGAGGDGAGDQDSAALRILAAANSAAFMSPRRVVLANSIQRLSKDDQDSLALGIEHLGGQTCLILVVDAPLYEAGKPKGKQIENALKKSAASHGIVLTCESPDVKDLHSRAVSLIQSAGKTADSSVIDLLVARSTAASSSSGGNLNILRSEIDKLVTYVGDAPSITARDAQLLVAQLPEENIFQMLDAVGAKDSRKALLLASNMLDSGENPEGVIARSLVMLQRHFRWLCLAKSASEAGNSRSQDFKESLSTEMAGWMSSQGYRLSGYSRQAANFTWPELIDAITSIMLCDMSMKGIVSADTLIDGASAFFSDSATDNFKLLLTQLCKKSAPAAATRAPRRR